MRINERKKGNGYKSDVLDEKKRKKSCCRSCKNWIQVDPENAKMEKKLGMKISNISLYNYMNVIDALQEKIINQENELKVSKQESEILFEKMAEMAQF